jgi:hypothetical protein
MKSSLSVCVSWGVVMATLSSAVAQTIPSPPSYIIHRAGLYGPSQTGVTGIQVSEFDALIPNGLVGGASNRITGASTFNGLNTWVYNPLTNTTTQTGLTGSLYTGSAGYQNSSNIVHSDTGYLVGTSDRITGVKTGNGQNIWTYDPVSHTTTQAGLTSATFTGSSGYQHTTVDGVNDSGQVFGISRRITGLFNEDGFATWAYNPVTHASVRTGIFDAAHTAVGGYQFSYNQNETASGLVTGNSSTYDALGQTSGRDTWLYNPATSTTVRIGLSGPDYVSGAGGSITDAGFATGVTFQRVEGGQIPWGYDVSTNTSYRIGLFGGAYTGSDGYEFGYGEYMSQSGYVTGVSEVAIDQDYDNGYHTWVYNHATGTTTRTGLADAAHTGAGNYQLSFDSFLNEAGQVAGISMRTPDAYDVSNGQNTWAYNPATHTTVQTGLTGPAHTGTAGFQYSDNNLQNAAGGVAGFSLRSPESFDVNNGRNTWAYNPTTNVAVQTGLTGPAHTGSAGYQYGENDLEDDAGRVAGFSQRITGVNTINGRNTWVFNPATNITTQTGLTGPAHTGTAGFQSSVNVSLNAAGQLVGISQRITGVDTENGQDAWYFDPSTDLTYDITAGVPGRVRTSDQYAFSNLTALTVDGFAFGQYTFFDGGLGSGESRPFLYRPDVGFYELDSLIAGGLPGNGWAGLTSAQAAYLLNEVVGYGLTIGQPSGSQSVFVLQQIPEPGAMGFLSLAGLLLARRRHSRRRRRIAVSSKL